jgi:hypothetical protein
VNRRHIVDDLFQAQVEIEDGVCPVSDSLEQEEIRSRRFIQWKPCPEWHHPAAAIFIGLVCN